jgi:hypothetical protein
MARSSVEQLITVAYAKRLGSKALVGRAVAVEVAAVIGVMKYMICIAIGCYCTASRSVLAALRSAVSKPSEKRS